MFECGYGLVVLVLFVYDGVCYGVFMMYVEYEWVFIVEFDELILNFGYVVVYGIDIYVWWECECEFECCE